MLEKINISCYINVAFVVSDQYQDMGIGTELLSYLIFLAKKQGLLGFTAEVLKENRPMQHLFEKTGLQMEKVSSREMFEIKLVF